MIKKLLSTLAGAGLATLIASTASAQGYEHQPDSKEKKKPAVEQAEQKETKSTSLYDDSYLRKIDFVEGTETEADSSKSIDVLLGLRGTSSSTYSGVSGNAILSFKLSDDSHFAGKVYAGIASEKTKFDEAEDLDAVTQTYGFGLRYFTGGKDFSFAIEPQLFVRKIKYEQGSVDIDRDDLSLGALAALRFKDTHLMFQISGNIDGEYDADLGGNKIHGDMKRLSFYPRLAHRLYNDGDTSVYVIASGKIDKDNFKGFFQNDSTRERISLVLDKNDYDLWLAAEHIKGESKNRFSGIESDGSRTRIGPGVGFRIGKNAYLFGEAGGENADGKTGGYFNGGLQVRF